MAGRVVKENIRLERLMGRGEVQTKVESAVMLGGERGVQVVATDAQCEIQAAETQADGVAVQCALECAVLYLTQTGDLRSDRVRNDFTAVIPIAGAAAGQQARVRATVGGVTAAERDGRLVMSVQVMLSGAALEAVQRQVAVDVAAETDMAKRFAQMQYPGTAAFAQSREVLSAVMPLVQDEWSQVVWHKAWAEIAHVQAMDGAAEISGLVTVDCLLAGEAQQEPIWQQVEIPYTAELVSDDIRSDMKLSIDTQIRDVHAYVQEAAEGEKAALHAECVLKLTAEGCSVWEMTVLQDLYPLTEEPFEATFAKVEYVEALEEAEQTGIVEAMLELLGDAPAIRHIVGAFAAPVLLETAEDNGMRVEGLMRVTLLYRTDGQDALVRYEQEVPFGVTFDEIAGLSQVWSMEMKHVQAQRISSSQAQVRMEMEMKVMEASAAQTDVAEEISFEGEPVQLTAGITLYYPEAGEELWDVAKRYRVREEALKVSGEVGKAPVMVYRRLTEF